MERQRVYDRVAPLAQQAQDISISLGGLVTQPEWPVSTAQQAMGFFQGMYDVVQQVVDAVDEYLREVPRPAAEASSSRYLQKPIRTTCSTPLLILALQAALPALTMAQPDCLPSGIGTIGPLC